MFLEISIESKDMQLKKGGISREWHVTMNSFQIHSTWRTEE